MPPSGAGLSHNSARVLLPPLEGTCGETSDMNSKYRLATMNSHETSSLMKSVVIVRPIVRGAGGGG